MTQFKSLQYALFSTSFVELLGGVFFLMTSAYILRDKSKVEAAVAGKNRRFSVTFISHVPFLFESFRLLFFFAQLFFIHK